LVLALGSVDALLTFLAVLAIALGIFADLPSDAAWIATLLAFAGVFGAVHVALKIAIFDRTLFGAAVGCCFGYAGVCGFVASFPSRRDLV